jgi:hypothetical protein
MQTFRLLCAIGIVSLSASAGSAWAQVDKDDPESQLEEEDAGPSTDCVENKTCQKVQSEDEKQKPDPAEIEEDEPPAKKPSPS